MQQTFRLNERKVTLSYRNFKNLQCSSKKCHQLSDIVTEGLLPRINMSDILFVSQRLLSNISKSYFTKLYPLIVDF